MKLFQFFFALLSLQMFCQEPHKSSDMVSLFDVKTSMEYLTSNELTGRATGTVGSEKAAIFIEQYLKKNNIKPYFKTYRDSFKIEAIDGYNIVGVIEGSDPKLKDEFVILGGHYDHIGYIKEMDGDSIANGANDDASGTVMAMEIGKYFSKTKSNKRSILITLFDAEEIGLKGSTHLAKRLKNKGLDVYTMLNFEMIGVPRATTKSKAYITGFDKSNYAAQLNKYFGSTLVDYFPMAKKYQLFFRSDNYPFYKAFKIPAHAISTFDFTNYDYYHHVKDESDQMDYQHMTDFINQFIIAIEGVINSETKEVKLNNE